MPGAFAQSAEVSEGVGVEINQDAGGVGEAFEFHGVRDGG